MVVKERIDNEDFIIGFFYLDPVKRRMTDIYNSENGMIYSKGKFEGAPVYAPYFYNLYQQGFHDKKKNGIYYFYIVEEDRKLFPEISSDKVFLKFKITKSRVEEIE